MSFGPVSSNGDYGLFIYCDESVKMLNRPSMPNSISISLAGAWSAAKATDKMKSLYGHPY